MEEKEKRKRKISVLTIFIWIALVITMSVVISGINKSSALEDDIQVDERKITIKLDLDEYAKYVKNNTENTEDYLKTMCMWVFGFYGVDTDGNIGDRAKFINVENDIAIYELNIREDVKYSEIKITFGISLDGERNNFDKYFLTEDNNTLEFNIFYGSNGNSTFIRKIEDNEDIKDIYEFKIKGTKHVKIKFDYSSLDDISKQKFIENNHMEFNKDSKYVDKRRNIYQFISRDDEYVIYEAYLFSIDYNLIIPIYSTNREYGIYEKNKILEYVGKGWKKKITSKEMLDEYIFEIKKKRPEIQSSLEWKDDQYVGLKYFNQFKRGFYNMQQKYDSDGNQYMLYVEKIDKNFTISDEYKDDPKWLIVDEKDIINTKFDIEKQSDREYYEELLLNLEDNANVPRYIFYSLFKEYKDSEYDKDVWGGIYPNKEKYYIYIKDKNILYSLIEDEDVMKNINLKYIGDDYNILDSEFNFSTKVICFYTFYYNSYGFTRYQYLEIPVNDKKIENKSNEKTEVVVNKLVKEEKGNKIYHIGLFESEEDEVTDKVYELETEDGVGSIRIEIENYDKSKKYYIYEVDENGKKISGDNIEYNKNRVFEEENIVNKYDILSNKDRVSSVLTIAEIENNERIIKNLNGEEEKYIDNSLVFNKVNEDTVTIAPVDLHIVKYETKHQGKLDGKTMESVKHGNKPVNVPKVVANDGYEFDKWVIIKDGEEIEVNPSEYVILEDTTFIAKYKEIKIEVNSDTSDINVWLYVGTATISVIVIVIIVIIYVMNKKRKNR